MWNELWRGGGSIILNYIIPLKYNSIWYLQYTITNQISVVWGEQNENVKNMREGLEFWLSLKF